MKLHGNSSFTAWSAGLMIGLTLLSGCTAWKPAPPQADPTGVVAVQNHVRLTLAGGRQVVVWTPYIAADSLKGFDREPNRERYDFGPDFAGAPGASPVGYALKDILRLETRQTDALRTSALVVGAGAFLAIMVALAVGNASSAPPPPSGNYDDFVISCPLVYSWDGGGWQLDSGTFGGAIFPALARTDVDNLIFPRPENGRLRFRLKDIAPETEYVDAFSILAVDHDPDVTVAPDGNGVLHTIGALAPPIAARDFRGADALERVGSVDGRGWESSPSGRDPSQESDLRDGLELEFSRPGHTPAARLVIDGNNTPWAALLMGEYVRAHGRGTDAWYDSLIADSARARRTGSILAREGFLGVSVWAGGAWKPQGLVMEAGPEVSKRQVFPLDLSGVEGDRVRVRLESAPLFWWIDGVGLDSSPERPVRVREVPALRAVSGTGADIRPLLAAFDRRYFVMEPGDSADVEFEAPPAAPGQARSWLARTSGWYRIHGPESGEPQTALLQRIDTEPFGVSRIAVEKMNAALDALRAGTEGRRPPGR